MPPALDWPCLEPPSALDARLLEGHTLKKQPGNLPPRPRWLREQGMFLQHEGRDG